MIYLLVQNVGYPVPYAAFEDIMPSFQNSRYLNTYVSRARPWLRANGMYVMVAKGAYTCRHNYDLRAMRYYGEPK